MTEPWTLGAAFILYFDYFVTDLFPVFGVNCAGALVFIVDSGGLLAISARY